MNYFFKFFLFVGFMWLSSCDNQPAKPAQVPTAATPYFNLSAFISEQIKQLQSDGVKVEKTVTTRPDLPETKLLTTVNWEQELETFTQADINKPALRTAYQVTTSPASNGESKTTYRKRAGYRDSPIEYLEIITSPTKQVKQISGRYRENNYLVSSEKDFSLTCAPVNGQNRIVTYQVSGAQKTIFFDPLRYIVQSKIQ